MQRLLGILRRLDGRGYKAYKELQGQSFEIEDWTLRFDHVQGDPYAAPSRLRARTELTATAIPPRALDGPARRCATRDFVARSFRRAARSCSEIAIDAGAQTVLDRTACLIPDSHLELRFTVDLPATGRRILGRRASEILAGDLPHCLKHSSLPEHLDPGALERHCAAVEDQRAIRTALCDHDLVAFVGNGSILPRRSGVDDRVLADGVPFQSPRSLEVEIEAPNAGTIRGMGIRRGITVVVGGGFHGKSTLLRAIETGIWDHVPGDGRELVVSDPGAVKIRAEDGRAVHAVDISDFIDHLPGSRATDAFVTELASGSTSQAAALVEALEVRATALLLDEDTSATNFMIRDRRMQALVAKASEPITPFVDRIGELRDQLGVSCVLVMGGSGDYFDHADCVIQMDAYRAHDVTDRARNIAEQLHTGRVEERESALRTPAARYLDPSSLAPERRPGRWKIQARGRDTLLFGRSQVEVRALEQLQDGSQLRTIGWLLGRLSELPEDPSPPLPFIIESLERLEGGDWDWLTGRPDGDLALPRAHEVMAALNRLRGARFAAAEDGKS
jgi:predicted ABC-class ATPase